MKKKKSRYLGEDEPELNIGRGAIYAWQRQRRGASEAAQAFLMICRGDETGLERFAFAGGRLLGQLEALRLALRWLLEYRFGRAPVAQRLRQLDEIDDPRVLERYFTWALKCQVLSEFL